MKIHQMLNPSCGDHNGHRSSVSPTPASLPCLVAPTALPTRQKIPKDAAIFSEDAKIVGIVNFPPYEARDNEDLVAHQREFQIYPLGEIYTRTARHVPYNSDKKDFLDKTGRDAFEMFQYIYKRPGEQKEYVVVWDYNVGLVRMTPFFKSCKYSKTIPAKALRENPGLKDISYSITGGSLLCQGYWMPYHAAKAVAATFCYDIRWALTPVFGNDFPSMCLHPKDPGFAKFLIDPTIVQYCTRETNRFRTEGECYSVLASKAPLPTETPRMHFGSPRWSAKVTKQGRVQPADIESGYGTDTDQSDKCLLSTQVSPRSQCTWTPVNGSQSPSSPRSPVSNRAPRVLPTVNSVPGGHYDECLRKKRTHSKVALSDHCTDETLTWPQTAAAVDSNSGHGSEGFGRVAIHTRSDIDAAKALVSLSRTGSTLPPTKRTRRGPKY